MRFSFNLYALLRRCVQIVIVAAFCALPWMNALDMHRVSGSLFALDIAGVPFADPVAALQVAAEGCAPAGRFLAGAVLSLLVALLLGRVFCSWICPYGLFSELIHSLRRAAGARPDGGSGQKNGAFLFKAGIVVLGLAGAAVLGFPLLSQISLPGELSLVPLVAWQETVHPMVKSLPMMLLGALALPAAALVVEAVGGRRFWCRYVCPQSVLLGLTSRCLPGWMPGLCVRRNAHRCPCRGEHPCITVCSLGLNPRQPGGPSRRDCTMCGDCLRACAGHGRALHWEWRAAGRNRPGDGSAS